VDDPGRPELVVSTSGSKGAVSGSAAGTEDVAAEPADLSVEAGSTGTPDAGPAAPGDAVPGEPGGGPVAPRGRALSVSRSGLLAAGALSAGALVLYLGAAWITSGRAADATTVAGVQVGGLNRAETVTALERAYADLDGTVRLTASAGGVGRDVEVAELGLGLDAEAVAEQLTGFSLHPGTIWTRLRGGAQSTEPLLSAADLGPALAGFAESAAREPRNAAVVFDGTTARVEEAVPGTQPAETAPEQVSSTWLTGAVEVPMAVREPIVSTADAQRVVRELAGPAVAEPLTVRVGGSEVVLGPQELARNLSFTVQEGRLALVVDGKHLRRLLLAAQPQIERAPVDAKIVVNGGEPEIVAGRDGTRVRAADVAEQVRGVLVALDEERVAQVATVPAEPDLTTEKARELGVREQISTFSTDLTADPGRTENLRIAARTVDGTLVLPGQTFSLNRVLGERTAQKGYNPAPAINAGRLVQDYGGGVSQMATTIFNNVFFAGLEDVHHKPHSFYISRYPEGREATVNWPTVDLRWKNDSDTAVLIKASVGTQVTVSFYGTKHWDITAGRSARSNIRTPQTVYDDAPGCVAQSPSAGFDVTVTRTFRRPGTRRVVRTESFHSVYIAEDEVICGPDPAAAEPDDADRQDDRGKQSDQGGKSDQDDQDDQGERTGTGGRKRAD